MRGLVEMFPNFNEMFERHHQVYQSFLEDFLKEEVFCDEARQGLLEFIQNWNIRTGEFECNRYVVHKLDRKTFLIYMDDQWGELGEDEMRNRCVSNAFSISRDNLVKAIESYQIRGNTL